MKNKLIKFVLLILVILLYNCQGKKVLLVQKNIDLEFYSECNYWQSIPLDLRNKIYRLKILTTKNEEVHVKILFSKNDNYILIFKCNGGIQTPQYLGFYYNNDLFFVVNNTDIESTYNQYINFCRASKTDIIEKNSLWNQLLNFTTTELEDKYSKIRW